MSSAAQSLWGWYFEWGKNASRTTKYASPFHGLDNLSEERVAVVSECSADASCGQRLIPCRTGIFIYWR